MEKYSKRLRNTGIAITIVLLLFVLIGMTGESSINELDVNSQIGSCETNKGIFLGDISKGVPNGTGTFYNLDGSEYEGAIVNGLKEGKGTFAWENGDKYTGDFSADTLNGKGTYTYKDGATYKGEFAEGKRSGTGTFTYTDGASYEGEWKEDVIEGTGIYTFSDGLKLEGTFTNNTFLKGTCTRKNKKIVVTYPVENGALTGKAKAVLKSGETYDGDVSNDAFNGSVSIQYKNKDAYTGGITSNQKNGDGTYTWANGAHYTGKWSEDKMNGAGVYYYSGEQYPYLEGNFVNNNPDGNCIYHKDAGTQYTTTWANGVCTAIN